MDRLDHAAEDMFLTSAVLGREARITNPVDKETLARSCALIAVLFDQSQAPPRLDRQVHHSLYAGRVPHGARVWLAHTDPTGEAPLAWGSAKDMVLSVGTGGGNVDESDAYFITFGVGRFVAQVFIPTVRTTEGIEFQRFSSEANLHELWPDVLTPLIWPPPQTLPWDQMKDFTRAFQTIDRSP
jgi:hypothetical protein